MSMAKKAKNQLICFLLKKTNRLNALNSAKLLQLIREFRQKQVSFFGDHAKKLNDFYLKSVKRSESFRFFGNVKLTSGKAKNQLICFLLKKTNRLNALNSEKLFQLIGKFRQSQGFVFETIAKKLNGFYLKGVKRSESFRFLGNVNLMGEKAKNQLICFSVKNDLRLKSL